MKRRNVVAGLAVTGISLALSPFRTQANDTAPTGEKLAILADKNGSGAIPLRIAMVIFDRLTQLDFTGPFEIFARIPGVQVLVVAQTLELVTSDVGLHLVPTHTFETAGQVDVLFVPGGPGQNAQMTNPTMLDYLRKSAKKAKFVTSVCTGSLLLAAAGLLTGYRATCHWLSIDQLEIFGVEASSQRVVIDRDRITGAGVTSGMDFAFTVVSILRDENLAKQLELMLEYDPAPPFKTGTPKLAGRELVERVKTLAQPMLEERRAQSLLAMKQLRLNQYSNPK